MKNTFLNRDKLVAEQIIREHVRKRIVENLREKTIVENEIRKAVRRLMETETGTEEASSKTGINVLADLLEKIVPVLQDDYKMLTSSEEQRQSFRNHIVHAIKNSLRPIEAANDAETLPESYEFNVDLQKIAEEIKIDLDPDGDSEEVSGEFIDIDKEKSEGDDFVELEDQNETGRNFAATTFKKIEKQIVDAYDMLADEEDQNVFYDYLLTNVLLYFDKFEDELQPSLPSMTTPEYEEEKDSEEGSEAADEEDLEGLEDL